jgi:CheY-like chemotaxis protein
MLESYVEGLQDMMTTNQKTILLVEDEDEIGSHINARLTDRGHRVVRARDADDALKLAEQDHLSLILTDLDLPNLDQMMERLRAHETLQHMPVVVIDINHPQNVRPDLTILNNFDELDQLLESVPSH